MAEQVNYIAPDGVAQGTRLSPGGFEFGIQGWAPGPQRPVSITFFLNGMALVADQYGRPIRGAVVDNKEYWFAPGPPRQDDPTPGFITNTASGKPVTVKLANHAEVIAALAEDRVDWRKLTCSGWPQLPYDQLKAVPPGILPPIPETPEARALYLAELQKIREPTLRRAALQFRRESYADHEREVKAQED